jgi:pyruvate dehydrogenase E2 component (dihydrolipoamide acetyltransferase)
MNFEFKLPDIGEGLTEGELVKWHVKEGDMVQENQNLCNILTDKAEVEIPSPKSGRILKLAAKPGEKVQVHGPLVVIEVAGGPAGDAPAAAAAAHAAHAPAARSQSAASGGASSSTAVMATPAVRKLAQTLNVDLGAIRGSGPGGRVTEEDVRSAATGNGHSAAGVPAAAPAGSAGAAEERVPFIGIRRKTAEKLAESHRMNVSVTTMDEADVTALVELREEMRPEAERRKIKLTYLPFMIRALVKTLKEFPDLNASLDEKAGVLIRKRVYHVGIATSADQGLIVPVVRDAQKLDVWGIASEINRLADKVRSGKIELHELQGATFTVTNIGAVGGLFATPIINPPETGILGIMKIEKRPVAVDDQVRIRSRMNTVLTFDHRVLDGAAAAKFLVVFGKHIENPRTLL